MLRFSRNQMSVLAVESVEAVLEKHTDDLLDGIKEKVKEMRAIINSQRARIEQLEAQLAKVTLSGAEHTRKPKPDCYAVHQVTDDEGVEEWADVFTSPDVAQECAKNLQSKWPGDVFEVVPLYVSPRATQKPLTDEQIQDVWCSAKFEKGQHGPFWFARAIERAHYIFGDRNADNASAVCTET